MRGLTISFVFLLAMAGSRSADSEELESRDAKAPDLAPREWTRIGEWIEVGKLTKDAFVIHEYQHWAANSLLVRMRDGTLVLCDTPSHSPATQELMEWVESEFGRSIDIAINSHYHVDASGGNQVLLEHGVEVYGSEDTALALQEKGEALKQAVAGNFDKRPEIAQAFQDTKLATPSVLVPEEEGLVLHFGDQEVRIVDPGPGHALDNVATYFPDQKILFGGCLIRSEPTVGYTGDADVAHWPEAVRSLLELDAQYVIPGHGKRYSPHLLALTIEVTEAASMASE